MELQINQAFKDLIPPLSTEEYKQLEVNLLIEGCRDALVVWGDTLIDGHNRYEICTKNDISFNTVEVDFENDDEAKVWIIDNQNGRRNLTDGWKYELKQERKRLLTEQAKENIKTPTGGHNKLTLSQNDKVNTQKELASELGWSTGKVAQADYVWKHGDEEVKQLVKSGEETISGAYSKVKKVERKQHIEQQREDIVSGKLNLPEGLYEVIVIDPPWDYGEAGGFTPDQHDSAGNRGGVDYATMSISEIKNIELPATTDSVIFLWTTHKFLYSSFDILSTWGYDYKATIVWDKEKIGIGRTLRLQCEFCLLGVKGKPLLNTGSERDIIREPRREHSRKPEAFYSMVDRLTVGRKLDYFSRQGREGWDSYGAEASKF